MIAGLSVLMKEKPSTFFIVVWLAVMLPPLRHIIEMIGEEIIGEAIKEVVSNGRYIKVADRVRSKVDTTINPDALLQSIVQETEKELALA